jgi:hypothetical protein
MRSFALNEEQRLGQMFESEVLRDMRILAYDSRNKPVILIRISLLSMNVKVKIYKTIILPVVLYGCEMWSLALREKHRLRV